MRNTTRDWTNIKTWLKVKNYYIGSTHTGWAAVCRSGIVITASKSRVKVEWTVGADVGVERKTAEATLTWIRSAVSEAERQMEAMTHEADANNTAYKGGRL